MPSRGLHPDTLLGITLSATMSRNKYTSDPGPVVEELLQTAGDRLDILTDEAGRWIGCYEDEHTATLAAALRELPLDMAAAIALGRSRRNAGHSTQGYVAPPGIG